MMLLKMFWFPRLQSAVEVPATTHIAFVRLDHFLMQGKSSHCQLQPRFTRLLLPSNLGKAKQKLKINRHLPQYFTLKFILLNNRKLFFLRRYLYCCLQMKKPQAETRNCKLNKEIRYFVGPETYHYRNRWFWLWALGRSEWVNKP